MSGQIKDRENEVDALESSIASLKAQLAASVCETAKATETAKNGTQQEVARLEAENEQLRGEVTALGAQVRLETVRNRHGQGRFVFYLCPFVACCVCPYEHLHIFGFQLAP